MGRAPHQRRGLRVRVGREAEITGVDATVRARSDQRFFVTADGLEFSEPGHQDLPPFVVGLAHSADLGVLTNRRYRFGVKGVADDQTYRAMGIAFDEPPTHDQFPDDGAVVALDPAAEGAETGSGQRETT